MKLTENLDQNSAAFEQEIGEKIKSEVLALIKAMAAAGDRFEDLGEKDTRSGRSQRTKEAFIEWGKRELNDPVCKDRPIVDLMYQRYLDGYNAGRAQHEG